MNKNSGSSIRIIIFSHYNDKSISHSSDHGKIQTKGHTFDALGRKFAPVPEKKY